MPILKCPNCSTLNSFTARCCRHCGTKLRNQVTNYSDKDSKKIDTTKNEKNEKPSWSVKRLIGYCVMSAIGVFAAFIFFQHKSFYSNNVNPYEFDSVDVTECDTIGITEVEKSGNKKINFYSDISVFTVSRDYNLSISTSTDNTISAEDGGSVSVTLDLKNVTGDITTKIYNSNKQDVTNKFKLTKDSNKYTIAGIVGTTTAGTYTAVFTYKDAVAEKTFKVTSKAPSNVLVEKITIAGKTEVVAGGYLVLDATVTPKDATNKVLTWSSSDIKVATVDQEGIVKAVNEGTATITAEATDGSKVKGTINIKVIGKKVEQTSNDVKDDTNKDPEKSPETGLTSITTALLITMLLSVIAYVVFKKKNLFKRV